MDDLCHDLGSVAPKFGAASTVLLILTKLGAVNESFCSKVYPSDGGRTGDITGPQAVAAHSLDAGTDFSTRVPHSTRIAGFLFFAQSLFLQLSSRASVSPFPTLSRSLSSLAHAGPVLLPRCCQDVEIDPSPEARSHASCATRGRRLDCRQPTTPRPSSLPIIAAHEAAQIKFGCGGDA